MDISSEILSVLPSLINDVTDSVGKEEQMLSKSLDEKVQFAATEQFKSKREPDTEASGHTYVEQKTDPVTATVISQATLETLSRTLTDLNFFERIFLKLCTRYAIKNARLFPPDRQSKMIESSIKSVTVEECNRKIANIEEAASAIWVLYRIDPKMEYDNLLIIYSKCLLSKEAGNVITALIINALEVQIYDMKENTPPSPRKKSRISPPKPCPNIVGSDSETAFDTE